MLTTTSIKYKHLVRVQLCLWWLLRILEKSRVQLELRCVTDHWNQGGARSAAVLKRRGVHEKMGSCQSIFNHLRIDQQQTTSHSPYTVETKKRSFDVSDLEGANDVFLETGIKTSSGWQFSFQRELRLVPVDSNVNQNYIAVHFSFKFSLATSSELALRRFITGNCKPWYMHLIHLSRPIGVRAKQ